MWSRISAGREKLSEPGKEILPLMDHQHKGGGGGEGGGARSWQTPTHLNPEPPPSPKKKRARTPSAYFVPFPPSCPNQKDNRG